MNTFISKATPLPSPTTSDKSKPICSSYTKAYDVLFLQHTKQCVLILLVLATLTSICLESIHFTGPSWRTLIYTLLLWASLVFLLLYRLISNTFQRNVGPTLNSDLMAATTQRQNSIRILVYTGTSIFLVFSSFLLLFRTTIPSSVINKQLHHGTQQINLERLYVLLYACLLGLSFSIYRNYRQRWVIQMQVVQQNPLFLIKFYLRSSIKFPLLWSLGTFAGSYVFYIFFSGVIYKLATHVVGVFTTVLDTPIIGFRWWDVSLFVKMMIIGYFIIWNWTTMDLIVDAYFNKVDDCITPYSNSIGCLIDGLQQKKDEQLRVRAFAELARLSSIDPVKRKIIYNGTENNGNANVNANNNNNNNSTLPTWSRIRNECISAIEEYINRIDTEYKVDKKNDKLRPTSDSSSTTQRNKKSIQLVDGTNILAQRRKNVPQLDDRTFHTVSEAVTQFSDRFPSPDIHVGNLMTQAWAALLQSKIGKAIVSTRLQGNIGQWLHYMYDETQRRKMSIVFGNPAIPLYAIQTLSNLAIYSLTEDDLGHVQFDISIIINTLFDCLSTVDTYVMSPPPHYKKLSDVPDVPLMAPQQLDLALSDAILTIKLAFTDYLNGIIVDDKYLSLWNKIEV